MEAAFSGKRGKPPPSLQSLRLFRYPLSGGSRPRNTPALVLKLAVNISIAIYFAGRHKLRKFPKPP